MCTITQFSGAADIIVREKKDRLEMNKAILIAMAALGLLLAGCTKDDIANCKYVVSAAAKAAQDENYTRLASCYHPDAMAGIKNCTLSILTSGRDPEGTLRTLAFLGAKSVDDVRKMPDHVVFAAMLKALGANMPGSFASFKDAQCNIVGAVKESNLVHVLVRIHGNTQGIETKLIVVYTLKQAGPDWKIYPEVDFAGLSQASGR